MKATILNVKWIKEYDNKFKPGSKLQLFEVTYPDEDLQEVKGFYSSVSKDQKNFIQGQEAEFTTEDSEKNGKVYKNIKPIRAQKFSNFGRQLQKEQSRYSGFAMSYSKDLVVGGRIPADQMYNEAKKMFEFMVALDKTIQS